MGTAILLNEHGAEFNKISLTMLARGSGHLGIGHYLIDLGADVDERVDGFTPLCLALKQHTRNLVEFARMLLENGTDPTIRCTSVETHLDTWHSLRKALCVSSPAVAAFTILRLPCSVDRAKKNFMISKSRTPSRETFEWQKPGFVQLMMTFDLPLAFVRAASSRT